MPELNLNYLNPSGQLGPDYAPQLNPMQTREWVQKQYAAREAEQQNNMLAQLYAKHYDPQTGDVNYNSLIGEAAQNPLTARAIPDIMGEAQKQSQSMAEIAQKKALADKEKAAAAKDQDEIRREKIKEMATESYGRFRGVKDAESLLAWHLENPELEGTNKAERTAKLEDELARTGYEATHARIEGSLQAITGIKPEKVAESDLAQLLREQKNYKPNSPEWKAYQAKINDLSGGMSEYERAQIANEQARIKLLQDKAASGEGTSNEGKELLTSQVISLRDTYDALAEKGGIVDTNAPWYKNLGAWASASGPGQTVGKALGTDTQSLRNTIAQSRPLLLNAIKQATGMTAKQMDSNVELQMYLKAATDPTADIQSNRKALQKLNDLFGLGINLGPIESSARSAAPTPGGAGMGAGAQTPAATGGWGKATVVPGGK